VTVDQIEQSEQLASQWFLDNFQPNGSFPYLYDTQQDVYVAADNDLRQLMASRLLAEMARTDTLARRLHSTNLAYIDSNLLRLTSTGRAYIHFRGHGKLGSIAMALRMLSASPYYGTRAAQAHSFARTIRELMNDEGAFRPLIVGTAGADHTKRLLTFYSGEAILALLEYAERYRDTAAFAAARRAQRYYIRQYVSDIHENYHPAYVPWHTLALHRLYVTTGERSYASAAFLLLDTLLAIQDTVDVSGRFFNRDYTEFGPPHAAADAVYTEALAYGYELAHLTKDDTRLERYGKALRRALRHLLSLQITIARAAKLPDHARSVGAFRSGLGSWRIRIDNTQHALDALRKVLQLRNNGRLGCPTSAGLCKGPSCRVQRTPNCPLHVSTSRG
jgi:hypothetical protein